MSTCSGRPTRAGSMSACTPRTTPRSRRARVRASAVDGATPARVGELGVGRPAVGLQLAQDGEVDRVELVAGATGAAVRRSPWRAPTGMRFGVVRSSAAPCRRFFGCKPILPQIASRWAHVNDDRCPEQCRRRRPSGGPSSRASARAPSTPDAPTSPSSGCTRRRSTCRRPTRCPTSTSAATPTRPWRPVGVPTAGGNVYARLWNPTVARFEDALAELEGTSDAVAFGSGMAALTAVLLACVQAGRPARRGGAAAVRRLRPPARDRACSAPQVTLGDREHRGPGGAPRHRPGGLRDPRQPDPRARRHRRRRGAGRRRARCWWTRRSPHRCCSSRHGTALTLVMHSATKFLGGHGDVVGGVVACGDEWAHRLRSVRAITGALLHPLAAYLLQRGLPTLPLRVRAQQETATRGGGVALRPPARHRGAPPEPRGGRPAGAARSPAGRAGQPARLRGARWCGGGACGGVRRPAHHARRVARWRRHADPAPGVPHAPSGGGVAPSRWVRCCGCRAGSRTPPTSSPTSTRR